MNCITLLGTGLPTTQCLFGIPYAASSQEKQAQGRCHGGFVIPTGSSSTGSPWIRHYCCGIPRQVGPLRRRIAVVPRSKSLCQLLCCTGPVDIAPARSMRRAQTARVSRSCTAVAPKARRQEEGVAWTVYDNVIRYNLSHRGHCSSCGGGGCGSGRAGHSYAEGAHGAGAWCCGGGIVMQCA